MALTYAQISAVTEKKFIPKLVDNIFDSDPLLQRLKKKAIMLDGGERIVQPLGYATATANGWFSGSDTLDTTDNDTITAAEYLWKQLFASISITRLDELKNSGDAQILNFVKQKTQIAEKTMVDTLQTGLYNAGSDANAIEGLRVHVATNKTSGGISQSSYSWWQAQVDTTATLTLSALQTVWSNIALNDESPTVLIGTRANFNRYWALLQPQQRFQDASVAKGGFASLMFNGAPFIPGSKVTANYIYLLNENYLHLYIHRDENFRFSPFQKPINQNVKVAQIFAALAFGSSNNRMHGVMNSVTA